MMDIDAERQLVREVELKTSQRKKYFITTVVLAVLSTGLLAGIIALSVVHIRHLQGCNSSTTTNTDTSLADQFDNSPGPVVGPIGPIGVPEAPPLVTPRRIVVVPISARYDESSPPRPTGTTNGTSSPFTSSSSNTDNGMVCEPGSAYGGRQLDGLNHEVYMPLMQKALSLSPAAQTGGLRDYYHGSLRSIFRCVDGGGIELVAACKGGYVVSGEDQVECDAGGSYEGEGEASPSSESGLAGI